MLIFKKYVLIIYTNANREKQKYDIELKEVSSSKHCTIMDDPPPPPPSSLLYKDGVTRKTVTASLVPLWTTPPPNASSLL